MALSFIVDAFGNDAADGKPVGFGRLVESVRVSESEVQTSPSPPGGGLQYRS